MSENRTIHLFDIPMGGQAGFVWNRLHGEREDLCEALLQDPGTFLDERRELLQTRLRKIDDALDRLMSGSYGNCSKCGRAIDDSNLNLDPALALCLDCWGREPGAADLRVGKLDEVVLEQLTPFDTILLRTQNSEYRILLLEPKTGRALVEGGDYLGEPSEALVRGSAVLGSEFKPGSISVGCQLEMWVDKRVIITSPITSVHIKHNGAPESVQDISSALH